MKVIKRNGSVEQFNVKKIANAIHKVYQEIDEPYTFMDCIDQANFLTSYYIEENIEEIDIETIQDDVEMYLMGRKDTERQKLILDIEINKQKKEITLGLEMTKDKIWYYRNTPKRVKVKRFLKRISIGNTKLEKSLEIEKLFGVEETYMQSAERAILLVPTVM